MYGTLNYFFLHDLVWDNALPATDFDILLYRLSLIILEDFLATLLEVCFEFFTPLNFDPYNFTII